MPVISLNSVSFHYETSPEPVFTGLSLSIQTEWNTGVVGRNGRGKSTLLWLIAGGCEPNRGAIDRPIPAVMFPMPIGDPHQPTSELIREWIAPFKQWEAEMEQLLGSRPVPDLQRYGELAEQFDRHHGYTIDAMIERECAELGLASDALERPFESLSGGEQTRSMIAALFLKEDAFPLLDEPTNHLDMKGREELGDYLSRKHGFIVVSHDRAFLDQCCDHIIALNRNDIRVFPGTFTDWHEQTMLEEESERAQNAKLTREIEVLEKAARQRRTWSAITEKEKNKAADSGFVSHKAAKMMKRALSTERRMEKNIAQKQVLLKNVETTRPLVVNEGDDLPEVVLSVENVSLVLEGRPIIHDLSFTLRRGERLALIGDNGCGKTSVLRMLRGELQPTTGRVYIPRFISIANGYQHPLWRTGMLRDHLRENGIEETPFRTIMGSFGVCGEIFDRRLETFSRGELKKVDLCRSFLKPHHMLLWDEPVNYIDIQSKEQIEEAVLRDEPTMLFTEHDRTFFEKIATRVIVLPKRS